MTLEAWADADDVELYTGYAGATDDEILRAQDIIELFAGATYLATDNIAQTNLRRLNRAVAYQVGWARSHPDITIAVDVDSDSADGQSYTPSHVNAHLLAPLAKRHLDRLSWRLKPLRVRPMYGRPDFYDKGPRDSAVYDDTREWTPM
jgi:hypothetical protein